MEERAALVRKYMRILQSDERAAKLDALEEQKRFIKQRLKSVENYRLMLEAQLESVLDRIDYLNIYGG